MTVPRRTQAERATATVDALVDATLKCLSTEGFTGTSTRRVAELAGVSQGALQHHFVSKAALIDAAMNRLVTGMLEQPAAVVDDSLPEATQLRALLDALWDSFTRPEFGVVFELLNLARTHPETSTLTGTTLRSVHEQVLARASAVAPTYAGSAGFGDSLLFVLGALRDAALLRHIGTLDEGAPPWPELRERAMRLLTI